jgi:hypothetical protein
MGSKLAEALRKNRERSSKNFLPYFKFPEGKTDIRILPAAKGDDKDDWFLPVGMHYNVDDKRPLNCPYETAWAEDPCPICEMVKELRSDGMNDEAQKMSVRRQYLVRGVVRGEEDEGAQIIRLPSTLFQAIGEIIEDSDEYGDVLNPGAKGRDIRVTKTGKNLDTKYSASPRIKTSMALPKKDDIIALIKSLEEISSLANVPSFDELEKLLKEKVGYTVSMGDSFDDDDEDDAAPDVDDDDLDIEIEEEDDDDQSVDAEEVDDFFGDDDDDDDDDEDNSWMEEDKDDDEFDGAEEDDGKTGVKLDLEEDLGKKHKVTKKRGKSRTKKKG